MEEEEDDERDDDDDVKPVGLFQIGINNGGNNVDDASSHAVRGLDVDPLPQTYKVEPRTAPRSHYEVDRSTRRIACTLDQGYGNKMSSSSSSTILGLMGTLRQLLPQELSNRAAILEVIQSVEYQVIVAELQRDSKQLTKSLRERLGDFIQALASSSIDDTPTPTPKAKKERKRKVKEVAPRVIKKVKTERAEEEQGPPRTEEVRANLDYLSTLTPEEISFLNPNPHICE